MAWSDVGLLMSWGEAIRLLGLLRGDTTSHFAASMSGWDFPIDRATLALLDLYDLHATARWVDGGKKGPAPKPHPGRPFKIDDRAKTRRGNAGSRTPEQVKAILSEFGHPPV